MRQLVSAGDIAYRVDTLQAGSLVFIYLDASLRVEPDPQSITVNAGQICAAPAAIST